MYTNGLKLILKVCMNPDLSPHPKIVPQLYEQVVQSEIKSMYTADSSVNTLIRRCIIIQRSLPLFKYQEFDNQPLVELLQQQVRQALKQDEISKLSSDQRQQADNQKSLLLAKFLAAIYLLTIFQQQSPHLLSQEEQEPVAQFMFTNFTDYYGAYKDIPPNFVLSVLFDFINYSVEKYTIEVFAERLLVIEKVFKQSFLYNTALQPLQSNAISKQLIFLRKIIGIIEAFSEDFQQYVVTSVLNMAVVKLKEDAPLQEAMATQDIIKDEMNDIVVIEFAETISRFVTIIDDKFDENLLFELLSCR